MYTAKRTARSRMNIFLLDSFFDMKCHFFNVTHTGAPVMMMISSNSSVFLSGRAHAFFFLLLLSPNFCSLKGPRPPSHSSNRHSRTHTHTHATNDETQLRWREHTMMEEYMKLFRRGRIRLFSKMFLREDCNSNRDAFLWLDCSSFRERFRQKLRWRSSCSWQKLQWKGNSKPGPEPGPPWWLLLADAPGQLCSQPATMAHGLCPWHG